MSTFGTVRDPTDLSCNNESNEERRHVMVIDWHKIKFSEMVRPEARGRPTWIWVGYTCLTSIIANQKITGAHVVILSYTVQDH